MIHPTVNPGREADRDGCGTVQTPEEEWPRHEIGTVGHGHRGDNEEPVLAQFRGRDSQGVDGELGTGDG